jgi:hypothetical protein
MRLLLAIVVVFAFLVWDMARNNGHYTHLLNASVSSIGRQFR